MKDFSFWAEYEGASEGSGRSEKIWLMNSNTDKTGLFKFKKDKTTTDHISECIAYELAKLIEIPCARFEIGQYNGKEGSMSYNFVDKEGMILIEGIYFINLAYHSYDPECLLDIKSGERYSIEMIKKSIEPFQMFNRFLNIPIFDYLIGNTDRHQSNWGAIMEKNTFQLSPLYDNSSSLCAYIPDSKVEAYLGRDKLLWKSLVDTKSRSLIRIGKYDKKQPTHLEMLQALHTNYYDETKCIVNKIHSIVTDDAIYGILNKYESSSLNENRKELIARFLKEKVNMMKVIY